MEMDVKKISDNVKMQEWMLTVRTCRESGLSVTKWCSLNNVRSLPITTGSRKSEN